MLQIVNRNITRNIRISIIVRHSTSIVDIVWSLRIRANHGDNSSLIHITGRISYISLRAGMAESVERMVPIMSRCTPRINNLIIPKG